MRGFTAFLILLHQVSAAAASTTAPAQPQGLSAAQVRVETSEAPLHVMESLDTSFTIEVNGSPIAKGSVDGDEPVPAKVGSNAAVFTLKEGRLVCGDLVLGRNITENRSMLPKPVYWFKSSVDKGTVRPVAAEQEGSGYKILFAGMWFYVMTFLSVEILLIHD